MTIVPDWGALKGAMTLAASGDSSSSRTKVWQAGIGRASGGARDDEEAPRLDRGEVRQQTLQRPPEADPRCLGDQLHEHRVARR